MLLKYGCAFQSSVLLNSCCTSSPPYRPGGRLIECTTIRSICAAGGRAPWLGESRRRANRYQPDCHSAPDSLSDRFVMRLVAGSGDGQPCDAVADLPQAEAQPMRGRRAVESALVQGLDQDVAFLLVEIG